MDAKTRRLVARDSKSSLLNCSGDEGRIYRIERQRERLKQVRAFALPLIDFLDSFPKSALWGEWLDSLEAL